MVLLLEAPSVRYIPKRLSTIVSMQPLMMRNTEHVDNRRLSSRIYIAPTPVLFRNLAPRVSLASLRAARPPTAGSHCLTMPGKETPAHYFHHVADRHATWRTPRNRTNGEGNKETQNLVRFGPRAGRDAGNLNSSHHHQALLWPGKDVVFFQRIPM